MEEISLGIPATFSTWNAHTFDSFYERLAVEPRARQSHNISEFATKMPIIDSGVLIEDVHLGLCGLVPRIWNLAQLTDQRNSGKTAGLERLFIDLKIWEGRLQEIKDMLDFPEKEPEATMNLLKAYRGREEPSNEGAIVRRTKTLHFSAMMLHRNLAFELHNYISTSSTLTSLLGATSWSNAMPVDARASYHLRFAVLNSLEALIAFETIVQEQRAENNVLDPLAGTMLSRGAAAARSWFLKSASSCIPNIGYCMASYKKLDWSNPAAVDEWLRGQGTLVVEGIPFCHCQMDRWLYRLLRKKSIV